MSLERGESRSGRDAVVAHPGGLGDQVAQPCEEPRALRAGHHSAVVVDDDEAGRTDFDAVVDHVRSTLDQDVRHPDRPGPGGDQQLDGAFRGVRAAVVRSEARPARVVVIGHSSGAQLAAFAAFDEGEQDRHGVAAASIAGLVTIGGPLDLSLCKDGFVGRLVEGYAGPLGSEARRAADPIRQVRGEVSFPVLCLHGGRDPVVPVDCSRSFVERVNSVSPGRARLVIAEELHHVDTLRVFLDRHLEARRVLESRLLEIEES